jgi:hypothetical protein
MGAEVVLFRPKSAKIIRLGPLRTNDPFEGRRGLCRATIKVRQQRQSG